MDDLAHCAFWFPLDVPPDNMWAGQIFRFRSVRSYFEPCVMFVREIIHRSLLLNVLIILDSMPYLMRAHTTVKSKLRKKWGLIISAANRSSVWRRSVHFQIILRETLLLTWPSLTHLGTEGQLVRSWVEELVDAGKHYLHVRMCARGSQCAKG